MASREDKRGAIPYTFAAIPQEVLRSSEWIELPPSAVKLALFLVSTYTGKNNGRLCPSWEALRNAGYGMSKRTAIDAKRALLECEWCVQTRQGHAPRTADWLGFTFWRLNWVKEMDIEPRAFPYLNFVKLQQADPNTGRGPQPKTIQGGRNCTSTPQNRAYEVQKLHYGRDLERVQRCRNYTSPPMKPRKRLRCRNCTSYISMPSRERLNKPVWPACWEQ